MYLKLHQHDRKAQLNHFRWIFFLSLYIYNFIYYVGNSNLCWYLIQYMCYKYTPNVPIGITRASTSNDHCLINICVCIYVYMNTQRLVKRRYYVPNSIISLLFFSPLYTILYVCTKLFSVGGNVLGGRCHDTWESCIYNIIKRRCSGLRTDYYVY